MRPSRQKARRHQDVETALTAEFTPISTTSEDANTETKIRGVILQLCACLRLWLRAAHGRRLQQKGRSGESTPISLSEAPAVVDLDRATHDQTMRGVYNFLAEMREYKHNPKAWHVTLLSADCFWFDLIVNPPEWDSKGIITNYLTELKRQVEATLEKRFIYYFASRTKVRFDIEHPPYYARLTGRLVITFLIGATKRRFKWKMEVCDARTGKPLRPKITVTDKFIRVWRSEDSSVTFSVLPLRLKQGELLCS